MLYPKKYIKKENKPLKEILKYIKDCFIILFHAFSSYSSFIVFIEQKFHF